MPDDGLAHDRPGPADEVEHSGGEPDLVDDLREDERVQRRDLGRLQHHRASRGERRRHLRGDLVQRVVPGRDRADHTDRLAHHRGVADLLFELDLLDDLRHRHERRHRQAYLDDLGQAHRHAHLLGDELRQRLHPGLQALRDALEVLGTIVHGGLRPPRERLLRRGNRLVDVGGAPLRDPSDDLLRGGVDDVDRLRSGRGHPCPADVDLVPVLHRAPPTPRVQARAAYRNPPFDPT